MLGKLYKHLLRNKVDGIMITPLNDKSKSLDLLMKRKLDLGHSRVMHIKGGDDQPSLDKYMGFRKAVLDRGA